MAATWMARLGIKTRIVDKRGTKIFNGQADGLQCRSLEIFESFGFADRAWKESNHMLEVGKSSNDGRQIAYENRFACGSVENLLTVILPLDSHQLRIQMKKGY